MTFVVIGALRVKTTLHPNLCLEISDLSMMIITFLRQNKEILVSTVTDQKNNWLG